MTKEITLHIINKIQVTVPDSLNLITPYVLLEQQDWFEDEIKFVRSLLQPGQRAVDIGANYGLFTLSMAHAVGPTGAIWSFEPATSTREFLAKSVAVNQFDQITIDKRALSSEEGFAQLSLNENSELNEIVRSGSTATSTETITLTSLDCLMSEYPWSGVDFIKIDAEGEEAKIIAGGKKFLNITSPLIQYEVKAGVDLHLELIKTFKDIGYESYRLVPGLNALIPFDINDTADGFLLNLFCCKSDRAEILANRGLLIQSHQLSQASNDVLSAQLLQRWNGDARFDWSNTLTQLPYGQNLKQTWQESVVTRPNKAVEDALALYSISASTDTPLVDRFLALRCSFNLLKTVCITEPQRLRLVSLARVANELGERLMGSNALGTTAKEAMKTRKVDAGEPFLAASKRFDQIAPGDAMVKWVVGSVLEAFEQTSAFSSFYTGMAGRDRLRAIQNLGFGSEEMGRRLDLINRRFP